ncbi:MipA/OmpV family protein [Vibrio salinus]|uniref:MipA/OmpV family protein n=1 Tax=Vibrio salinus TaxID=2899784 RepID=UPI001E63376E|nr:MipA/OmpV family protein [Vibrio salinus]MCE0494837.1 MipA/OmpV family protein [Vibrio salinus]
MKKKTFINKHGTRVLFLTLSCLCSSYASAGASVGLGGGFGHHSEYKDYDGDTQYFPLINYEDNMFYFHVLSGGIFLLKDDYNAVTLGLSYFPKEFDASDSSDVRLQLLDDRDSTGMIDIGYRYMDPVLGTISTRISADFLDETDGGWKIDMGYSKRLPVSEFFMLTPGFGVTWFNDDLNDHLYGVSSVEASRSTLNEYHPDGSVSTYAELSADFIISESISLSASGRYTWLDSEVTNSPMVDSDHSVGAFVGINVSF